LPGHLFVEETDLAKEAPAALMGHELGHNLNLQHDFFSAANLMAPFFPPGTELTEDQVGQILQSPLIQTDSTGHKFIEVAPIAIVAVPEPSAALLFLAGLALLLVILTRTQASQICVFAAAMSPLALVASRLAQPAVMKYVDPVTYPASSEAR
jgi:hypothetical protein